MKPAGNCIHHFHPGNRRRHKRVTGIFISDFHIQLLQSHRRYFTAAFYHLFSRFFYPSGAHFGMKTVGAAPVHGFLCDSISNGRIPLLYFLLQAVISGNQDDRYSVSSRQSGVYGKFPCGPSIIADVLENASAYRMGKARRRSRCGCGSR